MSQHPLDAMIIRPGDDLDAVLTKLHARFAAMPRREERNGGQRCWYVQQEEVLGWLEDAMKKVCTKQTTVKDL